MDKDTRTSFQTAHRVYFGDAGKLTAIADNSVHLMVTSPPYPMIAMWDEMFSTKAKPIANALKRSDGPLAFDLMHRALNPVWKEAWRVLAPGGFACVNIGDAVRTIKDHFRLYPNHARILSDLLGLGFSALPAILWRKQTNAPNKFMGSGMLPAGAYVTLEHEYVLICRKGSKREFDTTDEKTNRRESAIFWEERNQWFSDIWMDLKGSRQALGGKEARKRSAAFPFELAYRLISMYSVRGDTVLDPFLGTGTTMAAAMAAGRNSFGVEIDPGLAPVIDETAGAAVSVANRRITDRLARHLQFVTERMANGKPPKHAHVHYRFPVVTRQEMHLKINLLMENKKTGTGCFQTTYGDGPAIPDEDGWHHTDPVETEAIPEGREKQLKLDL
jgi:modification methylase